jgi:hypothetical protein
MLLQTSLDYSIIQLGLRFERKTETESSAMKLFNAFSLLSVTFASASNHNNVADYQKRADMGNIRGQQQRFMQEEGEQELVTKTEWAECIGQDAKECASIVRSDARRHEIKNLQVRIVAPHTNDEIIDTYMKVGKLGNFWYEWRTYTVSQKQMI